MKKLHSLFVIAFGILIIFCFSLSVSAAETYTENGYTYTLDENGNAKITGADSGFAGDVTVPSQLGGHPVTVVGSAFVRNDNITSVSLPEGVTEITGFCFLECDGLKTIYLPSTLEIISSIAIYKNTSLESIFVDAGNTYFSSDGEGILYSNDMKSLVKYPSGKAAKSFTVPSFVTFIEKDAFSYSYNLTEIVFSDSVEAVGDFAFSSCENLEKISFNNALKSIGKYAFSGDEKLNNVSLPESLVSLGEYAFFSCKGLTEIKIPDKVTSLEPSVLGYCSALENVYIGSGVSSISVKAFDSALKLVSYEVSEDNLHFKSVNGVLFNKTGTELISFPCSKNTFTYEIPDGVTHILDNAFSSNKLVRRVIFSDTVTSVGANCFFNSVKLTYVGISSSVSSIGEGAFRYCPILTEFSVDGNNEYFYSDSAGALIDKYNKKFLYFPAMSYVFEYSIPDDVSEIGSYAFEETAYLEKLIIPDSVESISSSAFSFYNVEEIEIGSGVSYIGDNAFSCNTLVSINVKEENPWFISVDGILFDKELTRLYKYPENREIKSVVFPDTLTLIADYAFSGSDVENVVLPASVEKIGDYAFYYCDSLKTLSILNNNIEIQDNSSVISSTAVIYAYENSSAHNYAKKFGKSFVAFYDDADFTYDGGIVTVSGTKALAKPGDPLVYPWNHLAEATEVLIIENIPSVSSGCFVNLYGLTTIVFKGTDIRLSSSAFSGCYSLSTVVGFGDSHFSEQAFADSPDDVQYFSQASKTKPSVQNVITFRRTDSVVRFDNSVSMTSYEFFNLVVVICDSFDDVNELRFSEFTAEDFVLEKINENGEVEELSKFTDSGFIAKVYNDEDELEEISFNDLCDLVANNEIFMFKLVAKDINEEEAGSADVQADENILMFIFRAIITFFNKILRLFRR